MKQHGREAFNLIENYEVKTAENALWLIQRIANGEQEGGDGQDEHDALMVIDEVCQIMKGRLAR